MSILNPKSPENIPETRKQQLTENQRNTDYWKIS